MQSLQCEDSHDKPALTHQVVKLEYDLQLSANTKKSIPETFVH